VISRATLHNFDEIERLGINEGDTVLIERAGEVIPKIIKVVNSSGKTGKTAFKIPETCPECSQPVVKEKEEEVAYRCVNPLCPAQLMRGLVHFAAREAMDIEGLGEAAVIQLVQKKLVSDFADIYSLRKDDLLKLDLFKDKKSDKLLAAIENSKKQPLSRLIYALGIRHIGEKAAQVLALKFKTFDGIIDAPEEILTQTSEIGPVMAASISRFFRQKSTKNLISKLKNAGVNPLEPERETVESAITGKTFVFTGELTAFTRSEAEAMVAKLGAKATSSVTKKTDYVVSGGAPGSKHKKAQELGIRILTEQEFLSLIKQK
jgi:DNA ligase (NAD+)